MLEITKGICHVSDYLNRTPEIATKPNKRVGKAKTCLVLALAYHELLSPFLFVLKPLA